MKTVITTMTDNRYAYYAELFRWCCKKSYPEYDVVVLNKENHFPGYPDNGYTTNALRFLTGYEPYEGYDNVYITDIDMMILPEIPRLHDFHLREMKNRCYSNSLRNKHHTFELDGQTWDGLHSMTGLHFCNREWFERTNRSAAKYREFLKTNIVGRGFDGRILYLMAKENGLGLPAKYKQIKRHHGIHIGTFRLYDPQNPAINELERKNNPVRHGMASIRKRIGIRKCEIWRRYMRDPKYAEIVSRIKSEEVLTMVKSLEAFVK